MLFDRRISIGTYDHIIRVCTGVDCVQPILGLSREEEGPEEEGREHQGNL